MTLLHTLYIFTIFRIEVMLFFLKKKEKKKTYNFNFLRNEGISEFFFRGDMLYGKYTNKYYLKYSL